MPENLGNGRPWFVRYANSLGGVAGLHTGEVGPFGVPFQPSNEVEELFLQADPLMYKEFGSQAAAAAWIASAAGQKDLGIGKGPGSAIKTEVPGVADVGQFLGELSQPNLWLRVLKVVGGLVLIVVGLVQLTHAQRVIAPAARLAAIA